MFRKLLGMVTAALMLSGTAALLPARASSTEGVLTYEVTEDGVRIFYCDTSVEGDFVIPDTIGGVPVTWIGNSVFGDCKGLTSVTIPASVTRIDSTFTFTYSNVGVNADRNIYVDEGNECFTSLDGVLYTKDLKRLICHPIGKPYTETTFPDTLEVVGDRALAYCTATELTFPDGFKGFEGEPFYTSNSLQVLHLGSCFSQLGSGDTFGGCYALQEFDISAENPYFSSEDGALYSKDRTTLYRLPNGRKFSEYRFPAGLTRIADYAFDYCQGVTGTLVIPDGVTSLGAYAFGSCFGLEAVQLPDTLEEIGDHCFDCCYSLGSINFPKSLKRLGSCIFYFNRTLTSLTVPATVEEIGEDCFGQCEALEEVTSVPEKMFSCCTALQTVHLPESVTSIGGRAFSSCTSLAQVDLPSGVTAILYDTFNNCTSLAQITLPEHLRSIEYRAFQGCTALTDITLPERVTNLGDNAFSGCSALERITVLNPGCLDRYGNSVWSRDTISSGTDEDGNLFYTGVICGYEGSTAQLYADTYGYTFASLGEIPTLPVGDLDGGGKVNANDASAVLYAAARIGAKRDHGLSYLQLAAADVNRDGAVNANDAALILRYAAYAGAKGTDTFAAFLRRFGIAV